jgi:AbrB family looped-hinge helix DNA binding protein
MYIKVSTKRQVTFPAKVLASLGVSAGDQVELIEGPDGYLLRARRVDRSKIATLRHRIPTDAPAFDLQEFRNLTYESSLRD